MHYDDGLAAIAMRMRVLFAGAAMCRPSGVSNAVGAIEGMEADHLFQVAEFAFGAANLQPAFSTGNGDSRRVVSAILKTAQAINDYRYNLLLSDVSDDSAHGQLPAEK
jgi:hypothetical protein